MGGFLKIILLILIIFYAFKLLGNLLFPYIISKKINNDEHRKRKAWDDFLFRKKSEEGKVTVDFNGNKNKKRNNDGEYVDYEEIK